MVFTEGVKSLIIPHLGLFWVGRQKYVEVWDPEHAMCLGLMFVFVTSCFTRTRCPTSFHCSFTWWAPPVRGCLSSQPLHKRLSASLSLPDPLVLCVPANFTHGECYFLFSRWLLSLYLPGSNCFTLCGWIQMWRTLLCLKDHKLNYS